MDIFYIFVDKSSSNTKREIEYKAGRYIVEYVAKNFFNIKNSELEIINNKPKFKYSDLQFSISHSYNIVAVCFDKNPVGFDIEYIKPRDFIPIAQRMNFKMKKNTLEEFYRCWTKFEAEYKLQTNPKSIVTVPFLEKYIISAVSSVDNNVIKRVLRLKNLH